MILLNFGNLLLAFLDNGTDCTVPTTCGTAFITAKAGQACKNAPRCLCGTLGVVLAQGCGRIQHNWRSGPASAGAFAPIDLSKEPPHFRCLRSKVAGAVEPAKDMARSIKDFLTCFTRDSWSCASAATRARASVAMSSKSPAIWRAKFSSCSPKSAEETGLVNPWRCAFWLDRFFPEAERGPVLFFALRRLAAV